MGLLDTNDPMLDLGMGLLSASGPSRMPVSFGQVLASGYGQMQAAQRQRLEDEAMSQQMQMRGQGMQMQQMQMDALKRQLATKEALGRALAAGQNPGAATPAGPTPGGLSPSSAAAFGVPELATPDTPVRQGAQQQASMADQMMAAARQAGDYDAFQEAMRLKMEEKKLAPKFSTDLRVAIGPDGKLANFVLGDDGSYKQLPMGVAEKLHFANTGGQTVGLNQYTGAPVAQIRNTMSPDAVASNAVAWANQHLSADRFGFDKSQANKPQFKDGYWVVPPGPGQATGQVIETPLSAPPKGSPQALQQSSQKVIGLIDQAERLLNKSTGSYIGAGLDATGQAFGMATNGAKAVAQLKALEGALMMAQPRMEGPQSDKDAALYRQMAGQIGDSTVPVEIRRAALNTIRELSQRYGETTGKATQSTMSGGGWSATVIK